MLFYVYKKKWCRYTEHRGMIVNALNWRHAKGIAIDKWGKGNNNKKNIFVQELNVHEYGILCHTDGVETQHVVVYEEK